MEDSLFVVIPAYNEQEIISKVVDDWIQIVNKIGNGSKLLVINDGSKDNTYNVLLKKSKEYKIY